MARKEHTSDTHIVHLKMKRYVGAYMKCVYGEEPMVWPSRHPASLIMETSLVIDDDFSTIPYYCITDKMWKLCQEQALIKKNGVRTMDLFAEEFRLTGNTALVDDWDKESTAYFDVELPKVGLRRGGNLITNNITKISKRGVTAMVEVLSREFWIELFRFVNEERFWASERKHSIQLAEILENFCAMYSIPLSELENLNRKYREERKRLKDEIMERRENINPDMIDYLHEGRALSRKVAREEMLKARDEEKKFVGGEAISNVREYVGQKRGI